MTGPRPRNRGQRHQSGWRSALRSVGVTESKQQTEFLQELRKGWRAPLGAGITFAASTLATVDTVTANGQPFFQHLAATVHDGWGPAVAGAVVAIAGTYGSKYLDTRKASKQAARDRADGKNPDADPLEKFKEYDEKLTDHNQSITAQERRHRGLLGVTSRAIRNLTRRMIGAEQRADALQAQMAAVQHEFQSQLAAQRQYFEGQLAQKDRQLEERFGAQERRTRSEMDARTSSLSSRIDSHDERLDRHDSGFRLAQSAHQNSSARIDRLEQNQPQPGSLPPGDAARSQDLLNRARRARDETRGTANPPAGTVPRPGQPFNQPPPAQPRPNRPRQ